MAKAKNHNEASERAIIGLVLVDLDLFWRFKDRLTPELFYNTLHRRIVTILHKMAEANRMFELSYIAGQFEDDPESDFSIDGYLFTIQSEAGSKESAADLVDDLEELRAMRQAFDLGQALMKGSFKPELTARERLAEASKLFVQIHDGVGEQEQHISRYADRLLATTADAFQRGEVIGLRTGITGLDDLFGPLIGGNLYVIAGPSGSSKTAVSLQAATNMARSNPGAFFSQEMKGTSLAARQLGRMTSVSAGRINSASINADEYEELDTASRDLADISLYINEQTGLNHFQIRNRLHRLKRMHGCKFAVVDHLLLMGPTEAREDRISRISSNLKGLKDAAKVLDIPIIVLAQLTNEYEKLTWRELRRPVAHDCYGGASIKQDVDGLVFIYREDALLIAREPPRNKEADHAEWAHKLDMCRDKIEFSSGKYRDGSPEGVKVAAFNGPKMEVTNSPKRAKQPAHEVTGDLALL